MTPGRSPAYGLLASPHPSRGGPSNVMASPGRQGGFGGGPGGGPQGAGVYSGRVSTQQVRWRGVRAVLLRGSQHRHSLLHELASS